VKPSQRFDKTENKTPPEVPLKKSKKRRLTNLSSSESEEEERLPIINGGGSRANTTDLRVMNADLRRQLIEAQTQLNHVTSTNQVQSDCIKDGIAKNKIVNEAHKSLNEQIRTAEKALLNCRGKLSKAEKDLVDEQIKTGEKADQLRAGSLAECNRAVNTANLRADTAEKARHTAELAQKVAETERFGFMWECADLRETKDFLQELMRAQVETINIAAARDLGRMQTAADVRVCRGTLKEGGGVE
jgi:hypothetical protein